MLNIFKEFGITISLDASGRIKVDGLKTLPAIKADEIRDQIRQHRDALLHSLRCPARCKRTGLCYERAYFLGKPGPFPGPDCKINCGFNKIERKKNGEH